MTRGANGARCSTTNRTPFASVTSGSAATTAHPISNGMIAVPRMLHSPHRLIFLAILPLARDYS